MAQMFKQRIQFQFLDAGQQDNCAKVLAERAKAAHSNGDVKDAMRVLFLGTAWLSTPLRLITETQGFDSQNFIRRSVADALDTIDFSIDETHDRIAPAMAIIHEILQTCTGSLHDMEGSTEWLRIASTLRKGKSRGEKRLRDGDDGAEGGSDIGDVKRQREDGDEDDYAMGRKSRRPGAARSAGKPLIKRPLRVKQSGVRNVIWVEATGSWEVQFVHPESGNKTGKQFAVTRYMTEGCSFEEADEAALQAAIEYRRKLVKQGVLEPVSTYSSRVYGVSWINSRRYWQARPLVPGEKPMKFIPEVDTEEAIEKARLEAEDQRRAWEQELGLDDEVPQAKWKEPVRRQGGAPGVSWNTWAECWSVDLVQDTPHGRRRVQRRFRPASQTEEDIEKARLEANELYDEIIRGGGM